MDLLVLTDEANTNASVQSSAKSSLIYVDGRPGRLRCLAVGGLPAPAVSVQLVPASGPARPLQLAESWSVTVDGTTGLRVVRRVTEVATAAFRATTADDGAEIRCTATVGALPPRTTSVQLVVHCTFSVQHRAPSPKYIGSRVTIGGGAGEGVGGTMHSAPQL